MWPYAHSENHLVLTSRSSWLDRTEWSILAPRFRWAESQTLKHQLSKACKYIQTCGTLSISLTVHQSQVMQRCPLGSSCKNHGCRWVYKLFHRWYQWAGARQRDSAEMACTAHISWEQLHRPLNVCQMCSLSLRLKLWDNQRGLLHKKTGECA